MEKFAPLPPEGYDTPREGVSYPEIKKYTYFSRTAGRETNVNVMLPADCCPDKKYPVLYVLHGFFDNEDWMLRDAVSMPVILGDLIQQGLARDMIVVLPYIFCSPELPVVTGMNAESINAYDNFINDLFTDLMPFIESRFPASSERSMTAITGFSMGGRESLFIALSRPERFGYVGAVCPAPGLVKIENSPLHPGQLLREDMHFGGHSPASLLITYSLADNVVGDAPASYCDILTRNGEHPTVQMLKDTAHDPTSVKPHLYELLQMVFK